MASPTTVAVSMGAEKKPQKAYMIMVHVISVTSITGNPFLIHKPGVIASEGSPASFAIFPEIVTINTLAVEPMSPVATHAHTSGQTPEQRRDVYPCVSMPAMIGIIAAVTEYYRLPQTGMRLPT